MFQELRTRNSRGQIKNTPNVRRALLVEMLRKHASVRFPSSLPVAFVVAASTEHAQRKSERSRSPDLHQPKMLQDGRMAGLVKLHRSARPRGEWQVRAEAVWKLGGHCLLRHNFSQLADIRLRLVVWGVFDASEGLEGALARTKAWITASNCQDHPGIAASSPLIPTRATMRLML
jgi:hypothetical protein